MAASESSSCVPGNLVEQLKSLQGRTDRISNQTWDRINNYIEEKFGDFLTVKSQNKAGRQTTAEKLDILGKELSTSRNATEELTALVKNNQNYITELEKLVKDARKDANRSMKDLTKAESELDKMRHVRDAAINEKDSLAYTLQKCNSEIAILQEESKTFSQQLKEQIDLKCAALLDKNALESALTEAQGRQRQAEQDRLLLERQLNIINGELNITNENFDSLRSQCNTRLLEMETELSGKIESLKESNDKIIHLDKRNNELLAEMENLTKKAKECNDEQAILSENFQKELYTKSKLIDVYKIVESDLVSKTDELKMEIDLLQKLLNDASEKYVDLENSKKEIEKEHERILDTKDKNIASLKEDLESLNEVLKSTRQQKMDEYLSELVPSATAVSKLLNSGMSLTQVYNQLVQVMDELSTEKDANLELKNTIVEMKAQLEGNDAKLKQLQEEFDKLVDNNAVISVQLDTLVSENNQLKNECSEANKIADHYTKENICKKIDIDQLSRQVCFLLKELETLRGDSVAKENQNSPNMISNSTNSLFPSSSMISKPLITFSSIQELQENNRKLLQMVHELNAKQEEAEKTMNLLNIDDLQQRLQNYMKRVNDLMEAEQNNTKMMSILIRQRDEYKKLYESCPKSHVGNSLHSNSNSHNNMESSNNSLSPKMPSTSTELEKLQSQLTHAEKQLADFKEELKTYKDEKNTNEHMLIEQVDQMRKQISDLSIQNGTIISREEYNKEMISMLEVSVVTYQKQIVILEERNKAYSATIEKQESFLKQFREEAMNALRNASRAEVSLEHSQNDYKLLKVIENKLKIERDLLLSERQSQSSLKSNLELIKASVQRAEIETLVNNEARLNGALKDCENMRLKVQEIKKENSETQTQLQAKCDAALLRLEEEKSISVQLRKELIELRSQIDEKTKCIDELTLKLKSSSQTFTPKETSKGLKDVAKLENQVSAKLMEIESLNKQLTTANDLVKHYRDLSECAEKEFKALQEKHSEYKENTKKQLEELEYRETQFKEKCAELEVELSLQSNGQYGKEADLKSQFVDVKNKLDIALKDLEQKSSDLIKANDRVTELSNIAHNAEQKYAHEMMLHSSDIQTLTKVKAELQNLKSEIDELTSWKHQAIENLENDKLKWEIREKLLYSEKNEIEAKLADLIQQNSDLHDQIETVNNQLTDFHASKHSNSLNESSGDISINRSMNEEEIKSSEQLLRIIKSLRRDKDLTLAKFDILQAENKRLQSQFEITFKKLDEAKLLLSQEREKNMNKGAPVNETDLIRKVETLNALTDSNRSLREERDNLAIQVEELTIATKKLEEQMSPLQEKNKELSAKIETAQTEFGSLHSEIARWRTRCKALVERANKTSPEDWKRLQNERESLVKMLSVEQENVKKLNNELTSAQIHKSQLEEQITNGKQQLAMSNEEIKRLTDELNIVKQDIEKISQELRDSKILVSDVTNEKSNIMATLASLETNLKDSRNKEMQIRQIAKKYKAQFEELTKTVEENKKKSDGDTAAKDSFEAELKVIREMNNNLTKELEKQRGENQDKEEKAKLVLKQAKTKIMQLTEAKTQLTSQFLEAKKTIESLKQNKDEHDVRLTVLKSQYEGRLVRLEKEKSEVQAESIKEIDALQQKMDMLQRHTASQSENEKLAYDPPNANIKPMAALGRAGDPIASARPTAAVLPSSPATTAPPSSDFSPIPPTEEYIPVSSSKPLQNVLSDGSVVVEVPQEASQHTAAVLRIERETNASSAQQAPTSSEGSDLSSPVIPISTTKRPRPAEVTTQPIAKRTKVGVFERSTEVEYQVPTSSRCDQEDDGVIIVDSEEEDHQNDNNVDVNTNSGENESEADADMGSGEGNNEVGETVQAPDGEESCPAIASSEVDAIQELPAQSSVDGLAASDVVMTIAGSDDATAGVVATLRRNIPDTPSVASVAGYDDHDDGIVPSTPTLYVPRRNDGFGEAVSSPGANVGTSTETAAGRFTFATPALDDTHADLAAQIPPHDVPSIILSQAEENDAEASGDATLRSDTVSSEASPPEDDASAVSSQGNQPISPLQGASLEEGSEAEASAEASASESPSGPGSSKGQVI